MAQRIGTLRVRPRRRGRWLTLGVPVTAGLLLGIGSFLTLGVASLIGGGTLLAPLLSGLGVGVLVGGALGLALRNRRPAPVRLQDSGVAMPEGTLPALEGIVRTTRRRRRDLQRVRRHVRDRSVRPVLRRAETLLLRIDALVASPALQSRRPWDDDVLLLEGMAERYVPDLVRATEGNAGFLTAPGDGPRQTALANLRSIDAQLDALAMRLDEVEGRLVSGVTRELDVHAEFLRVRLAQGEPVRVSPPRR